MKKANKKSAVKKSPSASKAGVAPLGDRVLVQPLSAEEKTTSFGIVLPDSTKEKPEQGTVIAVGPGKRTDEGKMLPVSVKAGDKVLFSKYGYDEVKVDGVEYYIIAEGNILAVLN